MKDEAVNEIVADMRHAAIEAMVSKHVPENAYPEQWDTKGLDLDVRGILTLALPLDRWANEEGITAREMRDRIVRVADRWMEAKDQRFGAAAIGHMQKLILLHALDHLWREHLTMLDDLRRAIRWRSCARRQPLTEYRTEAFHLFKTMIRHLDEMVTALSMRVGIVSS
jgi:preprotein translocase subunit SecA